MSAVIYVNYPVQEDVTFDMDYYLSTHMQLVQKHWGPHGLQKWTIVKFDEGDPSGLYVQAILYWTSREDFDKCYALGIPEVHEDLRHYTNGMPSRWIGKAVLNG